MRPRTTILALVLVLVLAAACDTGPSTSTDTSSSTTTSTVASFPTVVVGEPSTEEYTATELKAAFDDLKVWRQVRRRFRDHYAGHWADPEAEVWGMVIAVTWKTDEVAGFLEEWIAGSPLGGHIKVATVAHSEDDITDDLNRLQSTYCLPGIVSSVVLVRENRGQVGVRDVAGFLAAAAEAGVEIPETVTVVEDDTGPDPTLYWLCEPVPCPCWGCSPHFTLSAGDDTAHPYGYSGTARSCEPQVPPTTVAWDGTFYCLGDRDCLVTVVPGELLLLTVDPVYPDMGVGFFWSGGTADLDFSPVGDGSWEITAPDQLGEYQLTIRVNSPGYEGTYGVDVIVEAP